MKTLKTIVLGAGPLGAVSHPRANPQVAEWLKQQVAAGTEVFVPEIADYEVRRERIRQQMKDSAGKLSLDQLDALLSLFTHLPLDTPTMRRAAELWATARNLGKPTADPKELDGGVSLAAQAERADAVVVTENVGHLSLFVETVDWRELQP